MLVNCTVWCVSLCALMVALAYVVFDSLHFLADRTLPASYCIEAMEITVEYSMA